MTAPEHAPRLLSRRHLLALMMAAPTVLFALGVTAVEGWRLREPKSPLFTTPVVYSLADAIQAGDVPRAHAFIRGGQDPNRSMPVRHPVLSGDRVVLVSPVLWATAVRNKAAVSMLLGFGARLETPADVASSCLADALGNADIAKLLREYGKALPPERCAAVRLGAAPLLSLVGNDLVGQ